MAKKKTTKATQTAETTVSVMTLEQLAAGYLAHMEETGKSAGTVFSYKLELVLAMQELGKDTQVVALTPERVLEFFTCDRTMRTKTGIEKARPTFQKTRRVLRLALQWAENSKLIEKAPLPEQAATF